MGIAMVVSPSWCAPHPANTHPIPRDGRRHCGVLERVLRRQWPESRQPPPELVTAVDELVALPVHIATRLAEELDEIWLGVGTVPDLDGLGALRGQPIRPGSPVRWAEAYALCASRQLGRLVRMLGGRESLGEARFVQAGRRTA
ncbi:hypothetical protein [Planomonospora algeriensis]